VREEEKERGESWEEKELGGRRVERVREGEEEC
jgi:hypothetical protein